MAERKINVGIIGTGWIGEIRAKTCANHPLIENVHLAEIDSAKLHQVAEATRAKTATTDYRELLRRDEIDAFFVCTTPETTHYPITKECLLARKHTLLEKPMGLALKEADEMMALAKEAGVKFTIGYTQRFNPKCVYVKQCLANGTLGRPVTALVSRNVSRSIGNKIGGRIRLSPAVMEATHDIDFILWCLDGIKPVRVYSEVVYRVMEKTHGVPDCQWILVTMEDGTAFTIGAGWALPPGYPHFSTTTIEFIGTEGALLIDDSHRDIILNTMKKGMVLPLSTMPGEQVGHVYQGPMEAETVHFIESVALDRPVLVTPEQARQVMEVTLAADLSAERHQPVSLPLEL
ncbi:MAG TPA: Gfo/Idh/MocA family oxidoreductase [Candidatus Binatia bacterium]|jgi:predicted dehydrogenase|nr:Gfo/Idh/MocA family oxidoreductase [Candidatus Binatia bacterium]